jgi:hypothetical protein
MKKVLVAVVAIFVATFVFAALAPAPEAQAKSGDLKISLQGSNAYPNAKGSAKYRNRGGEQEFQVEVENVKQLAGQKLIVFVSGKKVGTLKINDLGAGRLNLNSTQGDRVPRIESGSKVQVKTGAGVLVVSGKF